MEYGEWACEDVHSLTLKKEKRTDMKQKKNIAETVREIAAPVAEELGFLLWDVEYVKEGADMILWVVIDTDRPGGVSIEDCEKMHRTIDPLLDEADPIEEPYTLAVSSPGVERKLSRPEHFARMAGSEVRLRFYTAVDGSKSLRGTLAGLDGDDVVVTVAGEEKRFPLKSVAKCETVFDW